MPPSPAADVDVPPDVPLVPLLLDPVTVPEAPVVPLMEVCAPLAPEPALVWPPDPVCVVLSCPEPPTRPEEGLVPQPIGASAVAEIKASNLDCLRCIRRSFERNDKGEALRAFASS
jgi:hypothetical protein